MEPFPFLSSSFCCLFFIGVLDSWYFSVSRRDADALEILNCTTEKKKVLYTIAAQAFTSIARSAVVAPSNYQLLKSYLRRQTHPINAHMKSSFDHKLSVRIIFLFFFLWLCEAGAPLSFIQRLSTSNINMDMSTFTNLDENIVLVSFCVYEYIKQQFLIKFKPKRLPYLTLIFSAVPEPDSE